MDGFTEIYVNAAVKNYDDELNTNVSDLMDLFTDRETLNPEKFPNFSKRKNIFVNTEKGEFEMCEKVDQLVKAQLKEAELMNLFGYVERGTMKLTPAAKEAKLSVKEFKTQMQMRGYNVPQSVRRQTSPAK